MNIDNHRDLELALRQLPWKEPPQQLDAAIAALESMPEMPASEIPQRVMPPSSGVASRRFGWVALVSTAIAAGLSGLLIGHSTGPTPVAASATSTTQDLDPATTQSGIVPVKFNANAFTLLHKHSTRPEFNKCEDCHVSNRNRFENWFYGDAEFLEQNQDFRNCSDCHLAQ